MTAITEPTLIKLIEAMPEPAFVVEVAQKLWRINHRRVQGKSKLGYSDALLEKLYAVGYGLYEKGKLREAYKLLKELFIMDGKSYKISYALAAVTQRLGEWYEALVYYAYAMANNPAAPEPHYFAAECCVQIGKDKAAAEFYKKAASLCNQESKYQELKARCQTLSQALEKRLQEKKKPLRFESASKTSP